MLRAQGPRHIRRTLVLPLLIAGLVVACTPNDGRADRSRIAAESPASETTAANAAAAESPAPASPDGPATEAVAAPLRDAGPVEALVPGSLHVEDQDLLGDEGLTEERLAAWERECEEGRADACSHAGWYGAIWGEIRPYDAERARELFQRACDAGSGLGCSNLGFLHISDQIPNASQEAARAAFQRACDLEVGLGCSNLGWFVHSPEAGFDSNEQRSRELYAQACQFGAGLGCSNLAMAELERGSPEGDRAAAEALERGCALDNFDACNDLAWYVLLEGRGGTPNSSRAVEVLTYACEAGQATSCATVGNIFLEGRHAPQNLDRALQYLTRACDHGSEYGCEVLGNIMGQ